MTLPNDLANLFTLWSRGSRTKDTSVLRRDAARARRSSKNAP